MQIFKTPNFDFIRWRWHALALSLLVVGAGLFMISTRGLQKGVDFEGGTVVILKFNEAPDLNRITAALGGDAVVQQYGNPENRDVMIRVKRVGETTFDVVRRFVDEIVTLPDEQIFDAMLWVMGHAKLVVEGAAAAPVGALLQGLVRRRKDRCGIHVRTIWQPPFCGRFSRSIHRCRRKKWMT